MTVCDCKEHDCHWCVSEETRPTSRPEIFEWDDVRVRVEWETDSDEERPSVYQYRDGRDGHPKASCPRCGEAWLHTRRTNAAGVDFIAFQVQEVTVEHNQLVCGLCHQVIA